MKKRLLLIPTIALLASAPFMLGKPLSVYAEGEEQSSVVEETSVQEESSVVQEESSKKGISEIVIDGKTIEQWMKELADKETRNAVIVAIAIGLLPTALFLIKWLSERKILAQTKDALGEASELIKNIEGKNAELKEMLGNSEEQLKEKLASAETEAKKTQEMLDLIMKTDPKLIAAESYRKAKEMVEEKYGKGK